MMPDYPLGQTIDFKFTTRAFATGVPTVLAGTPVVEIYEDNSTTQITAAETLTISFDSVVGLNNLRIVATSGNGFESGKSYAAVISAGTVGGVSVVGEVVAQFSIERAAALMPTTAGRTLDVTATGAAGIDWANVENPTTAVDLAATDIQLADTITTYTGNTKQTADHTAGIAAIPTTAMRGTDNVVLAGPTKAQMDTAHALLATPAQVLTQINAALDTAISELSVAAPSATPTIRTGIMLMYMALRNKLVVQTSGTDAIEIYNNAGTKIAAKTITDDGSDYTEAEMA